MRRLPVFLSALVVVPAAIALPVLTPPTASPHPVAPKVVNLPVQLSAARTAHVAGAASTGLVSAEQSTASFSIVGAKWPDSFTGQLQVRTRHNGQWGTWTTLSASDTAPDDNSRDGRSEHAHNRGLTVAEPVFAGTSDGVQTRVLGTAVPPKGLAVTLVNPGTSAADAHPGGARPASTAQAATTQPTIYTRAQWGADESLRTYNAGCGTPSYADTVKVGFVHHTDTSNDYTQADVPSIIRGIYAYHVESNGWCDIGYNFLVDKYGGIWEGRYGGIDKAVIGAHTGGFNTESFAASMIGTFDTVTPTAAMQTAMQKLYAWKLGLNYRDPAGQTTLTAGYFSGSKYPAGTQVTFNVIAGHRDADYTTCPGDAGTATLPALRSGAKKLIGLGLVNPTVALPTDGTAPGATSFAAQLTQSANWNFQVKDASGAVLAQAAGSGTSAGGTWDGQDDATNKPLTPGTYTALMSADNAAGTALTYQQPFVVVPRADLVGVDAAQTGSGAVEVHSLSGTSNYQLFDQHRATARGAVDPSQWQFLVGPFAGSGQPDLWAVRERGGASGQVEVHVLSAASNYHTYVAHFVTPLGATTAGQWQFRLGRFGTDPTNDLFAIRYAGGASGAVELHVLAGAQNFHAWVMHAATPLPTSAPGQWSYLVGGLGATADLMAVRHQGTSSSGNAELHIVSAASTYHSFTLHRLLPVAGSTSPADEWSVADIDGDGRPDLALTELAGTSTGKTELHALSGVSNFTGWAVQTATGLGLQDPTNWTLQLAAAGTTG